MIDLERMDNMKITVYDIREWHQSQADDLIAQANEHIKMVTNIDTRPTTQKVERTPTDVVTHKIKEVLSQKGMRLKTILKTFNVGRWELQLILQEGGFTTNSRGWWRWDSPSSTPESSAVPGRTTLPRQ